MGSQPGSLPISFCIVYSIQTWVGLTVKHGAGLGDGLDVVLSAGKLLREQQSQGLSVLTLSASLRVREEEHAVFMM